MKIAFLSCVALAAVGALPAFAEDAAAPVTGKITPESATLPDSVMRLRAAYGAAWGDYGYDKDGKKSGDTTGVGVNAQGGALVFEYGITEKLSMQVLAPFKTSGQLEVVDETEFSNTVRAGIWDLLLANATLKGLYDAGTNAPIDISVGALGTVPAGYSVKTYLDAAVATALPTAVAAAKKSRVTDVKFATGLGDVELGLKYSLSTEKEPWFAGIPLYTSVAGGVRLPTGEFADAQKDGKQVNGRGTTDAALRLNADVLAVQGVMLQLENQSEMMLMKGKAYTTKEVDYERTGMRNQGYAKLVLAPGAWVPAVDLLSVSCKYGYDFDAKTKTDGKTQTADATQSRSLTSGFSLSGFSYGVPAILDVDYSMPLGGKNVSMATSGLVGTFKLYYKF
jgi:hypothetical protein